MHASSGWVLLLAVIVSAAAFQGIGSLPRAREPVPDGTASFATASPATAAQVLRDRGWNGWNRPDVAASVVPDGRAVLGEGHFSPPHTDFGYDTNGNLLYDFLVVNASISVSIADDYTVDGLLYKSNTSLFLYNGTVTHLLPGNWTISVFYDGPAINTSGVDGPYFVLLNLWDGPRNLLDSTSHTTQAYKHTDFDSAPAVFTPPHSDAGIDSDGDGRFNVLDVNASVTVNVAGEYYVNALLHDVSNTVSLFSSKFVTFDPGSRTVVLPFPGSAINASGVDGPYLIELGIYSTPQFHALDVDEHVTAAYDHLEFEEPAAMRSPYAPAAPTIDGALAADEWTRAHVEDLTAIPGNQVPARLLVMNDDNFLYVAYDAIGDTSLNSTDVASIAFDTTNDGRATTGREDEFVQGGWAPQDQAHYVFSAGANWTIHDSPFDPTFPNQRGLAGAWGFGSSPAANTNHRIYEFKIPLPLLGALPGDTLGFFGGSHLSPGVFDSANSGWSLWPYWNISWIPLSDYGDLTLASRGDSVPPTIAIVSPAQGNVSLTDSVTVTWNASDNESGLDHFDVRVDSRAAVQRPANSTSYTVPGLSDGPHRIEVTAYDVVANSQSASVEVTVDTSPPSLQITAPLDGDAVPSRAVLVTWSAADAGTGISGYRIQLDGGPEALLPASSTEYSFEELSEGVHQITLVAVDAVGHSQVESASFMVDLTGPSVAIESPSGDFLGTSTVSVSWTAADVGSGLAEVDVSVDGGTPSILPGTARSATVSALSDGPHTIRVTAIDAARNTASASVSVTIDTTVPSVTITAPGSGVIPSADVTVSFTSGDAGSGVDRIEIAVDEGAAARLRATETSYKLTGLSQGDHRVDVTVFDRAGNSRTMTVTFRVDTFFLSPSGPYGYAGIGVLVALVIGVVVAAVAIARRRRGVRPPPSPP
jgi:Big-like domain-containing protein